MSRIVIAAFRPKPGQEQALEALMRRYHGRLLAEGLITDRQHALMHARDGIVVEMFEWRSADLATAALTIRAVRQMRDEYAAVSDHLPFHELAEAHDVVAAFETIEDGALHPEFSP